MSLIEDIFYSHVFVVFDPLLRYIMIVEDGNTTQAVDKEVNEMKICTHAQQRSQQRGLSASDLNMVLRHGTQTKDGYFLRKSDVKSLEMALRKKIDRLHRLSGKYVVVDGDTVVTTYHPTKKKQKKILRDHTLNS